MQNQQVLASGLGRKIVDKILSTKDPYLACDFLCFWIEADHDDNHGTYTLLAQLLESILDDIPRLSRALRLLLNEPEKYFLPLHISALIDTLIFYHQHRFDVYSQVIIQLSSIFESLENPSVASRIAAASTGVASAELSIEDIRHFLKNYPMRFYGKLFSTMMPIHENNIRRYELFARGVNGGIINNVEPPIKGHENEPNHADMLADILFGRHGRLSGPSTVDCNSYKPLSSQPPVLPSSQMHSIDTIQKGRVCALVITGQLRGYKEAFHALSNTGFDAFFDEIIVVADVWKDVGGKLPIEHPERLFSGALLDSYKKARDSLGATSALELMPSFHKLFSHSFCVSPRDLIALYGSSSLVEVEDDSDERFHSYTNQQKYFYKIQSAWKKVQSLRDSGRHIDVVIRMRPDFHLGFSEGSSSWKLLFDEVMANPNLIVSDQAYHLHPHPSLFIGDFLSIGQPHAMSRYSDLTGFLRADFAIRNHFTIAYNCYCKGLDVVALTRYAMRSAGLFDVPLPSREALKEVLMSDLAFAASLGSDASRHIECILLSI